MNSVPASGTADDLLSFVRALYPICRSLTGDGVRRTLALIDAVCPLEIREVATGTPVFDWTVPPEWNVEGATIKRTSGETVVDFAWSNLHLVNYSIPFSGRLGREELLPHLHTLPDMPDRIPYRTSYYNRDWGFCLEHDRLLAMLDPAYDVEVLTRLEPGSLTYGECLIPGTGAGEVLISAHVCHPSLANDNLSSVAVAAFLAQRLRTMELRHSYRILFAPATIGSLVWMDRNRDRLDRLKAGLVLSCLGDAHAFQYKQTVASDALIDRVVAAVLRDRHPDASIEPFFPFGYDERQYNAPGFRLPVGNLSRSKWGEFPEYHTSADNPGFLDGAALEGSLQLLLDVVATLETERTYVNLAPYGEPQLGRRGLYSATGGAQDPKQLQLALLWVLNQSDGRTSLLDICERAAMPMSVIGRAAEALERAGLLREVADR